MTSTAPISVVDVSDVSQAFVQLMNDTLFGVGNFPDPSILTNATTPAYTGPIRVFIGWPSDDRLQADIVNSGGVNISVYEQAVMRYEPPHINSTRTLPQAATTAQLTTVGSTVVVSGVGSSANVLSIVFARVGGSYRPSDGESSASMATNLANAVVGATMAGSTITLPTNHGIVARVEGDISTLRETARQHQRFGIYIWAPSTSTRDIVGGIVHGALARTVQLTLPYGITTDALICRGMPNMPMEEKVGLFRRDEIWETCFPTVDLTTDPAVSIITTQTNGIITSVV